MHDDPVETRPEITSVRAGTELRRWYWLKTELVHLARHLGVRASGDKRTLTDRLAAHLDGNLPPRNERPRRASSVQLSGPLTLRTVIPPGQRSSQALREFFTEAIGPAFRFDGPMRQFIAEGAGCTLADAVQHWHATRDRGPSPIAPQFELNRFVRAWHEANPGGSHGDALEAWRAHRALPVDRRAPP